MTFPFPTLVDHPYYVPGVGFAPRPCSNHRVDPVFVTHTGWVVCQCKSCGHGALRAPDQREASDLSGVGGSNAIR